MIICGIKLTHDGGIALIDNGTLKFNIEIEKIGNNPRYSGIEDLSVIPGILEANGYRVEQVDSFVIDGWHGSGQHWNGPSTLSVMDGENSITLPVASYNERNRNENILMRLVFDNLFSIRGKKYNYSSFMHVTGHVMGAYCTSNFAKKNQSSYILTWDGGQYPRLYFFDAKTGVIRNLGHLFLFLGVIYSVFAQYFGPYKKTEAELNEDRKQKAIEGFFGGYSVAGKIMAYIAKGKPRLELFELFTSIRQEQTEVSNELEHIFSQKARQLIRPELYSDEDVLATLHCYLEQLLVDKLKEKLARYSFDDRNLCFAGGCALNIKWNSAIRNSGLFREVYVPPFPNDSGSAIGAACAEFFQTTGKKAIEWTVYSGPMLISKKLPEGWKEVKCSVRELAIHLYQSNEPVVFLNGPAELGPRALGNRSILAPAADDKMKDILNKAKRRESYRPVAPICLEEEATGIFDPGCPDPYMLFDHKVRDEWKSRVPAICHLDGTARLQTVNERDNKILYSLLEEFKALTGIPLLCNTSANFNGCGFFPDVESAMRWGQVNYIWSENILYHKIEHETIKVKSQLDTNLFHK